MPTAADDQLYLLALGSNRASRQGRTPPKMIAAALQAIAQAGIELVENSPVIATPPVGPAQRRFANGAALVRTPHRPPALLAILKSIERRLGRRPGQRWGNRCIDIDIILWNGGRWRTRALTLPHPLWRQRAFVLEPLSVVGGNWRDPFSSRRVRHWYAIAQKGRK